MMNGLRRVAVPVQARARADVMTFPAPVRGWIVDENLAAAKMGGARILENAFATQTTIRIRGGSDRHATIGSDPVLSLFAYDANNIRNLFASTATAIYDVTNPADATIAPTPDVSSLSGGYFSTAPLSTSGGSFLLCVNGADDMQVFDGANWAAIDGGSTPSFTGVATSDLSAVWVYRNRAFFVEEGTLSAWYLAVDSYAGAATEFPLNGVFLRGGSLLFGATWSLDAGSGIDDKCVFITDAGEVAIYEGSDPGDANDWRLVGRYEVGRPLGKNAVMQAGGDLLIATEEGIVPISAAINKDRAALSLASVSRKIAPEWTREVRKRTLPWQMVKWPRLKMGVVALPAATESDEYCFVVNIETGSWCKYTGWDTRSLCVHDGDLYFGTSDGRVMQAEVGGTDDGMPFVSTIVPNFDHLKRPGLHKAVRMARATWVASRPFVPKVSGAVNYTVALPAPPASTPDDLPLDEWDLGIWDTAKWDAGTVQTVSTKWVSIGVFGFTFAPQVQVTTGVTPTPDAELVSIDVTFETGGIGT